MQSTVLAVHQSTRHHFSKEPQLAVHLVAGIGVEGDAHAGTTVQHLYQKRKDPSRPNLRQVHLIHSELFAMLQQRGFDVQPGQLGENITTRGIDLLHLPEGTELHLGGSAMVRLTGLRTPCVLIDRFCPGLMKELIADATAKKYLAGVMSVVIASGEVRPGDEIRVVLPEGTVRGLAPI
ncbi:MAG: MOSC domain-containing protein [Acidobacteria bacterium]|nr:MOSC domain-containing protein [Acidobacteriota bacterium]